MNSNPKPPKINPPKLTAHALLIGEGNAVPLTGCSMRWCRDTAQRLGVPIIRASRHKHFVRADLFLAALERANVPAPGEHSETPALVDCGDPAEAVRRMLGKRKAGGQ